MITTKSPGTTHAPQRTAMAKHLPAPTGTLDGWVLRDRPTTQTNLLLSQTRYLSASGLRHQLQKCWRGANA
ncbi:hypothetical protein PC128_g10798 [Phytophthora cactorum]|nr:hypothetical protein PC120_g7811 [Phytophthora cactorum]KAG3191756.1 hypothetical protein PC128_g10798 [Phytophthora cactorum]KAG4056994.1 hypothetical protein PC123_g7985 [Phytophthora cactorum]